MPSPFNGKRFFLTYPRCDQSKESLLTFLRTKGTIKSFTIGRELHEDGFPHLHAFVEFFSHKRGPTRWLDFEGHHPNVQSPRNPIACRNYCKKDGDFIENEGEEIRGDEVWADDFEDEESWFRHCVAKKIPFQYARYFWDKKNETDTLLENDYPGQVHQALENFIYEDWSRSLILKGPSGCGKTTWAKRNVPKPALFVSHVDQLKGFKKGYHKGIVFDDMDFNHWNRNAQIHLVDNENSRAIHCRYAVAHIPAGTAKIFTCNVTPFLVDDEAIRRRVIIRNVHV
ncbi:replication-associated protein [Capybara virus 11_cap1_98]|uniref:Replication-associated protein n=1 Tax=Capybara virus 11_cap1_98 TaxID=2585038 RepID=A0A514TRW2_9VIRU|nr:replication-associated protein [Capybara virus 11_cap1_98]